MTTPTMSPAPCAGLRIRVWVDQHDQGDGFWCEVKQRPVMRGSRGTCVFCNEFEETPWPPEKPWEGEVE